MLTRLLVFTPLSTTKTIEGKTNTTLVVVASISFSNQYVPVMMFAPGSF
jgi:hypothetical protein